MAGTSCGQGTEQHGANTDHKWGLSPRNTGFSVMKLWRMFGALLLSAALLWFTFRNVDFVAVRQVLADVRVSFVFLHVLLAVMGQSLRLWRWDQLVRPFTPVPALTLVRIGSVGNLLMVMLPLRLGELARPLMLRKECGVSATSGMAAVAVERTLDGLIVVGFFFMSLLMLPETVQIPQVLHAAAMMALMLFGGVALVLILAVLNHDKVCGLVRRVGMPLFPKVTEHVLSLLDAFVVGLKAMPSMGAVLGVSLLTGAAWGCGAVGYNVLSYAFGWQLPWAAGFLILAVNALSVMIPAGPAFLGPFQLGLTLGLGIFGIDATGAAAYGLLAYPVMLLNVVMFALPFFMLPAWRRHDGSVAPVT